MRADVVHTLPYTDVTDVPVTKPSGTGTITTRQMTDDEVTAAVARERRKQPLGFAPPAKKGKRA